MRRRIKLEFATVYKDNGRLKMVIIVNLDNYIKGRDITEVSMTDFIKNGYIFMSYSRQIVVGYPTNTKLDKENKTIKIDCNLINDNKTFNTILMYKSVIPIGCIFHIFNTTAVLDSIFVFPKEINDSEKTLSYSY